MKTKIIALVAVAFGVLLAGTHIAGERVQAQNIGVPNNCAVPKSYGDFKGMTGTSFVFENSTSGTIKVLNCKGSQWTPDAQVTRSEN